MKIAALCPTWNRPVYLGHLIACFLKQDHADRELVILDDAGQYGNQEGDRWKIVSTKERYATLGEKRNAIAAMAAPDTEAFAVWDDDDLYLPHALSASVAALEHAEWSRPSLVLHPRVVAENQWHLRQHLTGGLYHAGWSYRRDAFLHSGGYPAKNNGEDQFFMQKLIRVGATQSDPIQLGHGPFYIYPWAEISGTPHLSWAGKCGYEKWGKATIERAVVTPTDPPWLDLCNPIIESRVYPRPF